MGSSVITLSTTPPPLNHSLHPGRLPLRQSGRRPPPRPKPNVVHRSAAPLAPLLPRPARRRPRTGRRRAVGGGLRRLELHQTRLGGAAAGGAVAGRAAAAGRAVAAPGAPPGAAPSRATPCPLAPPRPPPTPSTGPACPRPPGRAWVGRGSEGEGAWVGQRTSLRHPIPLP